MRNLRFIYLSMLLTTFAIGCKAEEKPGPDAHVSSNITAPL